MKNKDISNGRKFSFSFEDSETLQKDIMAFYNRAARVDPLTFSETFRNFKAMIRNQGGG